MLVNWPQRLGPMAMALALATAGHACELCRQAYVTALEAAPKASALHPQAPVVAYRLEVSEKMLSPAGQPVKVLALNGGTPGPVLRFREGDVARVTVVNSLTDETTSIHWHGLLVPNSQDGVPYVTTPPIQPGETYRAVWVFDAQADRLSRLPKPPSGGLCGLVLHNASQWWAMIAK